MYTVLCRQSNRTVSYFEEAWRKVEEKPPLEIATREHGTQDFVRDKRELRPLFSSSPQVSLSRLPSLEYFRDVSSLSSNLATSNYSQTVPPTSKVSKRRSCMIFHGRIGDRFFFSLRRWITFSLNKTNFVKWKQQRSRSIIHDRRVVSCYFSSTQFTMFRGIALKIFTDGISFRIHFSGMNLSERFSLNDMYLNVKSNNEERSMICRSRAIKFDLCFEFPEKIN